MAADRAPWPMAFWVELGGGDELDGDRAAPPPDGVAVRAGITTPTAPWCANAGPVCTRLMDATSVIEPCRGRLAAMSDKYEVPWGERPAVAAPPDLHARYETDAGTYATTRIYAFSAEGHPLVLRFGKQLVRPEVAETKMTYVGVHVPFGPPLAGPFTPAPTGLVAVFSDGREQPVLFYDVHGRAVLIDFDDVTCDLVLAETVTDLQRVEFRSVSGEPAPD